MTKQQQTAFDHPCYLGVETMRPRFGTHSDTQIMRLTVDAGYA